MKLKKLANMSLALAALLVCLSVSAALAQESPTAQDPLARSLSGLVQSNIRNVLAAAELMPESEWSFRPAPKARTFGELVAHVADANRTFCSSTAASGEPFDPRSEKRARSGSPTKEELIADLRASFEPCREALVALDDARLSELVELGGGSRIDEVAVPRRTFPLGAVLAVFASHTSLHYGNMTTYLRIKTLVPPTSQNDSQ